MPKFDPARTAPHCESLEPATDATGKVVGYYLKLGDGNEAYMSEEFIRSHFTAAPKVITPTPVPTAGASGAGALPGTTVSPTIVTDFGKK